jgi:hypothetical protein
MIPTLYCLVENCNRELEEISELESSFCTEHLNQVCSEDYFALLCWSCGSVIDTYHKTSFAKKVVVADDYIFAKTCPKCNKEANLRSLSFVTINSKDPSSPKTVINQDGELVVEGKILGTNSLSKSYPKAPPKRLRCFK